MTRAGILLIGLSSFLAIQDAQMEKARRTVLTHGAVCPDPAHPCEGFRANELSFKINKPFAFDRGRDKSTPFYAVLLRTAPLCSVTDAERVKVQALFPREKVFVHQFFCADFGDKVTYTNVNEKVGFVAVYAGATEAEGKKLLDRVKAIGQFPGANLRRLEVVVVYQLE
jgi:hypothetical protein